MGGGGGQEVQALGRKREQATVDEVVEDQAREGAFRPRGPRPSV